MADAVKVTFFGREVEPRELVLEESEKVYAVTSDVYQRWLAATEAKDQAAHRRLTIEITSALAAAAEVLCGIYGIPVPAGQTVKRAGLGAIYDFLRAQVDARDPADILLDPLRAFVVEVGSRKKRNAGDTVEASIEEAGRHIDKLLAVAAEKIMREQFAAAEQGKAKSPAAEAPSRGEG